MTQDKNLTYRGSGADLATDIKAMLPPEELRRLLSGLVPEKSPVEESKPTAILTLTKSEFEALPEYSCSIPTGTTTGKRWRRKKDYYDASKGWIVGEYVPDPDPKKTQVKWWEVTILEAQPQPEIGQDSAPTNVKEKIKEDLTQYLRGYDAGMEKALRMFLKPAHDEPNIDAQWVVNRCDEGLSVDVGAIPYYKALEIIRSQALASLTEAKRIKKKTTHDFASTTEAEIQFLKEKLAQSEETVNLWRKAYQDEFRKLSGTSPDKGISP